MRGDSAVTVPATGALSGSTAPAMIAEFDLDAGEEPVHEQAGVQDHAGPAQQPHRRD